MTSNLKPLVSLTERIESCPLSRTEIAKRVGISRQLLGRWEHGSKIEKVTQLSRLATALNCDPSHLSPDLRDSSA